MQASFVACKASKSKLKGTVLSTFFSMLFEHFIQEETKKNYFILATLPLIATTEYYIYIIVHCSCVVCYSDRLSYHGGEKESIVSRRNSSYRLKNRTGNDKFSKLIVTFTLNAKVIVAMWFLTFSFKLLHNSVLKT